MLPSPLKIRTKLNIAALRIFSLPSVCQTEFNSNTRREIHRLAFALCRLELDLLRRAGCRFIETMAQTAHHSVHLNCAVCQEYHFENNVAFNLQTTPFCGVLRTWFVQDVNRRCCAFARRCFLLGRFGSDRLVREAGALQRAALGAAWWRNRCAITEAGARHRAANSFIPAGAVAVSRSSRQRRRAKTIHVGGLVRIALTGYSVGIAESAGLHFVHRRHYRWRSCAPRSKIADFHIFFRPLRLILRRIDFHLLENRIEFHGLRLQGLWLGWLYLRREENVRLFRIQLHGFRLHRFWFRRRNFGLHLRRRWRRWRWWRNRDFRNRLHQLRDT